ncbi:MAG: glycosyltransferase family 2 protein [Pseudohongiella sp.]|uniref:glycosyltransferase family 2 protein n=1 Tax=Pseudohongiella sp. TaxID=1979412 RepID=UPI00349FD346
MKLSVVISTYNSPEWLTKVLWGYSRQTHADFELIIADDGSAAATRECIDQLREETGMTIKHVWQPDEGFRKCRILNLATLQAEADYVVYTDGDCIPRRDFLAVHAAEATPGYFLSGGYHKLPMDVSRAISREDILSGRCFDLRWLRDQGLPASYRNSKLTAGPRRARLFNLATPTRCRFKGSNGSAWLNDILAVNGFDERMPWGGEDREFGVRLINAGIKPRHVRYNAIVIHLDHARSYRDESIVRQNRVLREANEKNRVTWTDHGISQHQNENASQLKATAAAVSTPDC